MPKGGYVPAVRFQDIPAPNLLPSAPAASRWRRKWLWVSLCGGLACVLGIVWLKQTGNSRHINVNSAAYDLYLRARALEALPNSTGIESSIDLFEQAVSKDPLFAPAYAGIAAGDAARSAFDRLEPGRRAEDHLRGLECGSKRR